MEAKKCCANCKHMCKKIAITNSKPYCLFHEGFVTRVPYKTHVCEKWEKRKGPDFDMGW